MKLSPLLESQHRTKRTAKLADGKVLVLDLHPDLNIALRASVLEFYWQGSFLTDPDFDIDNFLITLHAGFSGPNIPDATLIQFVKALAKKLRGKTQHDAESLLDGMRDAYHFHMVADEAECEEQHDFIKKVAQEA
jgi:hypothetical protein